MSRFRKVIAPHSFPTWVRTLDLAIQFDTPCSPVQIKGWCGKCGQTRLVDFRKLREVKGGDYSLINRRTRCKFTEGCDGWVKFHFLLGVFRPLWDDDTGARWSDIDWHDQWKDQPTVAGEQGD